MEKYVYKFKAGDPWDIEEQESWFSDMAKEGLILYEVGKILLHLGRTIHRKLNADEVVKDLVNKYGGYGDLSEVENPNFDSLYISKGGVLNGFSFI